VPIGHRRGRRLIDCGGVDMLELVGGSLAVMSDDRFGGVGERLQDLQQLRDVAQQDIIGHAVRHRVRRPFAGQPRCRQIAWALTRWCGTERRSWRCAGRLRPLRSSSQRTLCWREVDSNLRSPVRGDTPVAVVAHHIVDLDRLTSGFDDL
jgi:hypothetical protein